MKLAVSIPDVIFQEAEAFAKSARTSRSGLYARALEEYMVRHSPDRITEDMDRVLALTGQEDGAFLRRAARRVLERTEW